MDEELMGLNNEQREAVVNTDGPMLIIAGPGTGKTHTLIKRTIYLIKEKKLQPEEIMIVTFTEKAANELVSRLSNELLRIGLNLNVNEMYIGTFHSICLRILKENIAKTRLKKNFRLMDEFEQQYFVYSHFYEFKNIDGFETVFSNNRSVWDKCSELIKYISSITEEMIDEELLLKDENLYINFIGKVVKSYNDMRKNENLLDFSSIMSETYKLLNDNEELLHEYQDKIKYIMIDEYQDTNYIQEQFSLMLSAKHNNICVVGDDDQGLYRFRGATIRNILEFPYHFKEGCKVVKLVKNYRSEPGIIDFYNEWMDITSGDGYEFDWGKYRYPKKITASKDNQNNGYTVLKLEAKEDEDYFEKVYYFIKRLQENKSLTNLNQIAFLFRSVKNEKVKRLADYLENKGINIFSPRSDMFFDRKEVKQMLGCLILMFQQEIIKINKMLTEESYLQEMGRYYLSCIDEAKKIIQSDSTGKLMTFIKVKAANHIGIDKPLDYAFSGLLYQLLQFEPFSEYADRDMNDGMVDLRPTRNIGILINTIIKFEYLNNIIVFSKKNLDKGLTNLFERYLRFLIDGGMDEYEDENDYAPDGCVSFFTIHQSKGLEFPVVIVGNLGSPRDDIDDVIFDIKNKFSIRKNFEPYENIKYFDFWRLYYTAFSRAKNLLVLLADKTKDATRNEPSKYFEEVYSHTKDNLDVEVDSYLFDKVKKGNIKNSYSFTSDIQVYENCPTQYKFFNELGYNPIRMGATLFGSLVHETIEDVHKFVLNNELEKINDETIKSCLDINYETLSKRENTYLNQTFIDNAYQQVMSYVNNRKDYWYKVKEAEIPISYVKDDYILNGKVDLIQCENEKYEVVDFKSEKKPDINNDNEKLERTKKQLEIYAYLIEKKYDVEVDKLTIYYTSEMDANPTITFSKNEKEISNTISKFDEVVKQIESRKYNKKCENKKLCRNCDLRYYCRRNEE